MNNKSGRGHGAKYIGSLQEPSFSGFVQDAWENMHPLDKAALATMPVPILGDFVGAAADARTLWNDPSWTNAGLMGLGMIPFIPSLGIIKAFHGTPHTVDKFSMDKIGTGEGAQAYGHGLYFAESPKVAKQYADTGAFNKNLTGKTYSITDEFGDGYSVVEHSASRIPNSISYGSSQAVIKEGFNNPDDAIKYLKDNKIIDNNYLYTPNKGLAKHGGMLTNNPKVYSVDIDVEPEDLLDWDAFIDEMPAATEAKIKTFPYYEENVERLYEEMMGEYNPTYGNLYKYLEQDYEPTELAELMKKSGIKGIQYLDGMSRKAGKGTRNYVIFDDSLIGTPKPFGDY